MRSRTQVLMWSLLTGAAVAAVAPLLVPVPPLEGVVPPAELGYPDSRFIDVPVGGGAINVHVRELGVGAPLVLLHGFAASSFSWRYALPALAQDYRVIAYDRPAQGLTQRPLRGGWATPEEWRALNPYSAAGQVEMLTNLLNKLNIERAVLVGNSAGGSTAMLTALTHPERVKALVLVDPAVYNGGGAPGWIRPFFGLPQVDHLAPLLMRQFKKWGMTLANASWNDPSRMTDADREGYLLPLRAQDWDRGLWELVRASQSHGLPARLKELALPILVITGDDDRIVPTAESIRLAGELPNAELVVIPNCGHVPHEESPAPTLAAIRSFLALHGL